MVIGQEGEKDVRAPFQPHSVLKYQGTATRWREILRRISHLDAFLAPEEFHQITSTSITILTSTIINPIKALNFLL